MGEIVQISDVFNIIIFILLFSAGWYFGSRNERRHLAELEKNEYLLGHIIVSNERFFQPVLARGTQATLVTGSVVVAQDYFKMVVATVLSLFGKNLTTFETLIERARREALVRMKAQAHQMGYNQIYGVRLETTSLEGGVEVIAYGTAVMSVGNPKVPPKLP